MAVLSVDLAYRRWTDLGIVVLDRAVDRSVAAPVAPSGDVPFERLLNPAWEPHPSSSPFACEIIPSSAEGLDDGPIDANILAGRLNHLCNVRGIRVLMLDGPQAWKSLSNGFEHARASESQLNTAAKTGLPGIVKPATYRSFAEFCMDVYDALCRRGWRRFETQEHSGLPQERVLVESYPHAAWKSLGLTPLPSKRRTKVSDLAEAYAALNAIVPFTTNRPPNHDQLQAIVGGLPGLALEDQDAGGAKIVGTAPRREDGHWREGFIVLPVPPRRSINVRWLH